MLITLKKQIHSFNKPYWIEQLLLGAKYVSQTVWSKGKELSDLDTSEYLEEKNLFPF